MEYYFTLKRKEILTLATTLMIEDNLESEIRQLQKTNTVGFHLCEVSTVVKLRDRKQSRGFQRLDGGGGWEVVV